jgi:photosystem II stability/assembly factor-like uncharacterized protein
LCGAAAVLAVLLANPSHAQDPPAVPRLPQTARVEIGNDGTPMLLPFRCTDEDIRWAGLSCSEDAPCSLFLEITTVEAVGNRLLLAGNIHGDAVTLYSVLLASDDNGHNWQEVHQGIRGAGLDHIEYLGADTAWVSGQVVFPLTQDPFLLVTTDGGKTWTQRDVLNEDSESRFGTVQQFYFSSKDSGTLVVDRGPGAGGERYALYETSSGGETWALKQVGSKPIVVKRPVATVADWRVRADAGMKSYLLEHRVGTRWSAVAAFLVKLDPCKPGE